MHHIVIKEASRADAAMLANLGAQTFKDAFAAANTDEDMALYLAATFTPDIITKEFEEPGSHFYIAYAGEKAVGYAKTRWQSLPGEPGTHATEIQRLYVLQHYQNLQTGRKLMEHCLATIKQEGIKTVWLGVWEHNPGAIRFYERFGFKQFGSHIFQLGTDPQTDHLMKLHLDKE